MIYLCSYANDQDASSSGNGGRRRTGPISFEDILQEILVSITDGANTGRTPMFFNPGKIQLSKLKNYLNDNASIYR